MIDFTDNLPPIHMGFIDTYGRVTDMETGEIFTGETNV